MITYLSIKALKFLLDKNGDNAQLVNKNREYGKWHDYAQLIKESWEYWEMAIMLNWLRKVGNMGNGDNDQLVKKSWEYWEMLKNRALLKTKI